MQSHQMSQPMACYVKVDFQLKLTIILSAVRAQLRGRPHMMSGKGRHLHLLTRLTWLLRIRNCRFHRSKRIAVGLPWITWWQPLATLTPFPVRILPVMFVLYLTATNIHVTICFASLNYILLLRSKCLHKRSSSKCHLAVNKWTYLTVKMTFHHLVNYCEKKPQITTVPHKHVKFK